MRQLMDLARRTSPCMAALVLLLLGGCENLTGEAAPEAVPSESAFDPGVAVDDDFTMGWSTEALVQQLLTSPASTASKVGDAGPARTAQPGGKGFGYKASASSGALLRGCMRFAEDGNLEVTLFGTGSWTPAATLHDFALWEAATVKGELTYAFEGVSYYGDGTNLVARAIDSEGGRYAFTARRKRQCEPRPDPFVP